MESEETPQDHEKEKSEDNSCATAQRRTSPYQSWAEGS